MRTVKNCFFRIIKNYYPFGINDTMNQIEDEQQILAREIEFAMHSQNPLDIGIYRSTWFLALFRVLNKKGCDKDNIRIISIKIAHELNKPPSFVHQFLRKLRVKKLLSGFLKNDLPQFDRRISKLTHQEGFKAHLIQKNNADKGILFGFDVIECGICKLFQKHNEMGWMDIMCETDNVLINLTQLKVQRESSLAMGHSKCDFRFEKQSQSDK